RLKLAEFDLLAGNLDQARKKVRAVLERDDDHVDALFLRAAVAEKSGSLEKALRIYQEITAHPGLEAGRLVRALTARARVAARSGNLEEAEADLQRATALAEETLEPWLMLFNLYLARQSYQQAESVLTEVVESHPGNARLRLLLGKFHFQQGQVEQAEAAFLQATHIGQRDLVPWLMAGKFYAAVNKPEEALQMFETARRLEPRNASAIAALAEFQLSRGNYEAARAAIDDLLKDHPGYFPGRLLKVRQAIAAGAYDQAVALCDQYLQGNPASDDLFLLKGTAYLEQKNYSKAEESLRQAIRISPENIEAHVQLVNVYLQQEKTEQARQVNRQLLAVINEHSGMAGLVGDGDFQLQAVTEVPQSLDDLSRFVAAYPFGRMSLESQERLTLRYDRLISSLETLLDKNPTLIQLLESMAVLHAVKGEYKMALEKCDRQIERLQAYPDMVAEIYYIKGGLLLAAGEVDKSIQVYAAAIDLAPEFLKPYYGLAKCYIVKKDLQKAVAQYQAILEQEPDQAGPHLMMGVLYKLQGDFSAAETSYRRALEIDPGFTRAANNLAYLLAERGRKLDEALELALDARSRRADDPYIRDTLGWVYYRQGKFEEAIRELRVCVEGLPDNATAHYHLGMALYRHGDNEEAGHYLERALDMEPDFPYADQAAKILDKLSGEQNQ
ncbi:MAG: tetratricopeptide repeat protein, partial [Desulfosudaceae bacterium]